MRSLVLFLTIAFVVPSAEAGDFVPRKPPAASPPATAKPAPRRAKPVRKATRTASKPKKKARRHEEWKRPMP